jgi:hypothetical protein
LRLFVLWTIDEAQVLFGEMATGTHHHPSFESEQRRRELLQRLNQIPGSSLPDDKADKYPTFPISALVDPSAFQMFTGAMEWAIGEMRSSQSETSGFVSLGNAE